MKKKDQCEIQKDHPEKDRILELLLSGDFENEEEDPGVDYARRYREETGRDLETGEIVVQ